MPIPLNAADDARQSLDREADMVNRFARLYRSQLGQLVRTLEASFVRTAPPDADLIRHCVEVVDMVLASHAQFARSLKQLASAPEAPPARAAA